MLDTQHKRKHLAMDLYQISAADKRNESSGASHTAQEEAPGHGAPPNICSGQSTTKKTTLDTHDTAHDTTHDPPPQKIQPLIWNRTSQSQNRLTAHENKTTIYIVSASRVPIHKLRTAHTQSHLRHTAQRQVVRRLGAETSSTTTRKSESPNT